MDDGLSMVGLAVMRLWVMAKVKLFDAGGIRIGYMLGSASMLISAWCDTINYSIVGQVIQKVISVASYVGTCCRVSKPVWCWYWNECKFIEHKCKIIFIGLLSCLIVGFIPCQCLTFFASTLCPAISYIMPSFGISLSWHWSHHGTGVIMWLSPEGSLLGQPCMLYLILIQDPGYQDIWQDFNTAGINHNDEWRPRVQEWGE